MSCYKYRRRDFMAPCVWFCVVTLSTLLSPGVSSNSISAFTTNVSSSIPGNGSVLPKSTQYVTGSLRGSLSVANPLTSVVHNATVISATLPGSLTLVSVSSTPILKPETSTLHGTVSLTTFNSLVFPLVSTLQSDNTSFEALQSTASAIVTTLVLSSSSAVNDKKTLNTSAGQLSRSKEDDLSSLLLHTRATTNFTTTSAIPSSFTATIMSPSDQISTPTVTTRVNPASLSAGDSFSSGTISSVVSQSSYGPTISMNVSSSLLIAAVSTRQSVLARVTGTASFASGVGGLSMHNSSSMHRNQSANMATVSIEVPRTSHNGVPAVITASSLLLTNATSFRTAPTDLPTFFENQSTSYVPSRQISAFAATSQSGKRLVPSSMFGVDTSPLSSKHFLNSSSVVEASLSVMVTSSVFGFGSKKASSSLSSSMPSVHRSLFTNGATGFKNVSNALSEAAVMSSSQTATRDEVGQSRLSGSLLTPFVQESESETSSASVTVETSSILVTLGDVDGRSSLSFGPLATSGLSSASTLSSLAHSSVSVTPRKTPIKDVFIVASYSTPCYIYYVVEKTVPVATANHTQIPGTTIPKVTLDIGNPTSMPSELLTVTVTSSPIMTSKGDDGSQSHFSTAPLPSSSSTSVFGMTSSVISPSVVLNLSPSSKSVAKELSGDTTPSSRILSSVPIEFNPSVTVKESSYKTILTTVNVTEIHWSSRQTVATLLESSTIRSHLTSLASKTQNAIDSSRSKSVSVNQVPTHGSFPASKLIPTTTGSVEVVPSASSQLVASTNKGIQVTASVGRLALSSTSSSDDSRNISSGNSSFEMQTSVVVQESVNTTTSIYLTSFVSMKVKPSLLSTGNASFISGHQSQSKLPSSSEEQSLARTASLSAGGRFTTDLRLLSQGTSTESLSLSSSIVGSAIFGPPVKRRRKRAAGDLTNSTVISVTSSLVSSAVNHSMTISTQHLSASAKVSPSTDLKGVSNFPGRPSLTQMTVQLTPVAGNASQTTSQNGSVIYGTALVSGRKSFLTVMPVSSGPIQNETPSVEPLLHNSSMLTVITSFSSVNGTVMRATPSLYVSSQDLNHSESQPSFIAKSSSMAFQTVDLTSGSMQLSRVNSTQVHGVQLSSSLEQDSTPQAISLSRTTTVNVYSIVPSATLTVQQNGTVFITSIQRQLDGSSLMKPVGSSTELTPASVSLYNRTVSFLASTDMVKSSGLLDRSLLHSASSSIGKLESPVMDNSTSSTPSLSAEVPQSSKDSHIGAATIASFSFQVSQETQTSTFGRSIPSASSTISFATLTHQSLATGGPFFPSLPLSSSGRQLTPSSFTSLFGMTSSVISPSVVLNLSRSSGSVGKELSGDTTPSIRILSSVRPPTQQSFSSSTVTMVIPLSSLTGLTLPSSHHVSQTGKVTIARLGSSLPNSHDVSQAAEVTPVLTHTPTVADFSSERHTADKSFSASADQSSVFRGSPLVTLSSLGMCYVLYTTRVVLSSMMSSLPSTSHVPGPLPVNTTSAIVVPLSSIGVDSSVVLNGSSTQTLQVVLTSGNTSVQQSNVTSSVVLHSTVLVVTSSAFEVVTPSSGHVTKSSEVTGSQSIDSHPLPSIVSSKVKESTSILSSIQRSANATYSMQRLSSVMSKTPSVSHIMEASSYIGATSTGALSELSTSEAFITTTAAAPEVTTSEVVKSTTATTAVSKTSQVLPTPSPAMSPMNSSEVITPTSSVRSVASSSALPAPTQIPIPEATMMTRIIVPENESLQNIKGLLEGNLAKAFAFVEVVSTKRKRRGTDVVNATIENITRVGETGEVDVVFFIAKDNERLRSVDAVKRYDALTSTQLQSLIGYEIIQKPFALFGPTSAPPPPVHAVVSLIIHDSSSNNISVAENKRKLESELADYYKESIGLSSSSDVKATITTILHELNDVVYLEFYITVDGSEVNKTDVVKAFQVSNVNILTASLGVRVLVPVYVPDSLSSSESDHVIVVISVGNNQDLEDPGFRNDLADKLAEVYQTAKGRTSQRRRKRAIGSISATILNVTTAGNKKAEVTFFMFDAGKVPNGTFVASLMNRLTTSEMSIISAPYAILSPPMATYVPPVVTNAPSVVAATTIKWWIIPAVICPILLLIVVILLIYWRWRKGAPQSKVQPETIKMANTRGRVMKPVQGFDVARHTETEMSAMKTTAFMAPASHEVGDERLVKRETSVRRKVVRPSALRFPAREEKQRNAMYEESEKEGDAADEESVASATPRGSREVLLKKAPLPPPKRVPVFAPEPIDLGRDESEEESEESEEEEEENSSGPESASRARLQHVNHSAAQVPTVAVMSEASGPPRYPPVRFRSSVHPAPSLPPISTKQTSLVGARVEPPFGEEEPKRGRKQQLAKKELEQRADLERQKNKQRLRDRNRISGRVTPDGHAGGATWDKAQRAIDDVLEDGNDVNPFISKRKLRKARRRPPSSSIATDEESGPKLKSYRKLKSPKATSSSGYTGRPHTNDNYAGSVTNASSDESEIDMNETRRRMHALLDNAFSLFGPSFSKKMAAEPDGQELKYPEERTPRVVPSPKFLTGQPALPEPPPAHGRATEPTPRQRRRFQTSTPGYPAGMPQTPIGVPGYPAVMRQTPVGVPGYPVRTPERPLVTRDPVVVWDPAKRQRILDQRVPPPTYAYRDPGGQNVYITPVQQQRDNMGGLVWSPYAAEDAMDTIYPDLAQANYPGALGTSPPKNSTFLSQLQTTPHDTVVNMSSMDANGQRPSSFGQSPQPLIRSIKDELYRLSQGATRKTPIKEL